MSTPEVYRPTLAPRAKVFFTSDTHYWHRNIIQYSHRPFRTLDGQLDVEAMNLTLVNYWKRRVTSRDLVIHLGDFSFGHPPQGKAIMDQLPGRKVLVRGNHDRWTNKQYYDLGFEKVSQGMFWQSPQDGLFYLAHHPMSKSDLPKQARLQLCGHVHTLWPRAHTFWATYVDPKTGKVTHYVKGTPSPEGNCVNVGVDVRDYQPVTLEELLGIEGRQSLSPLDDDGRPPQE